MNIEELVPSLELCQKIPAGEFEDSCFIWVNGMDSKPKPICRPWDKKSTAAPAPTLEEIMAAMPHCICRYSYLGWGVASVYIDNNMPIFESNPATAALRLWLQLSDKSELSDKSDTEKACKYFAPKVITNGDRIQQMSNDELMKFKERAWCFYCAYHVDGGGRFTENCNKPAGKTCADGNKDWLNAPAESEKL